MREDAWTGGLACHSPAPARRGAVQALGRVTEVRLGRRLQTDHLRLLQLAATTGSRPRRIPGRHGHPHGWPGTERCQRPRLRGRDRVSLPSPGPVLQRGVHGSPDALASIHRPFRRYLGPGGLPPIWPREPTRGGFRAAAGAALLSPDRRRGRASRSAGAAEGALPALGAGPYAWFPLSSQCAFWSSTTTTASRTTSSN